LEKNFTRIFTSRDPSSMRLLEVACGTGRFHTFIKDNYPEMQVG
jgi:ubiquinone/menaquinone biosynthesis C-methylase UbiE